MEEAALAAGTPREALRAMIDIYLEMAEASGVRFRFEWDALPFLTGAARLAADMVFPGGAFGNLEHFGSRLARSRPLTDAEAMLLADPQTSGGLLVSVPAAGEGTFLSTLEREGGRAWKVGEAAEGSGVEVR
jgi:selenide,water dikinase